MRTRARTYLLLPMLALGLTPVQAWAHNIDFEWKQVGERVTVEAFFDDDTPAREARVQLLDQDKVVIASGVTDAKGLCTLPARVLGEHDLVVDAGAGHRKERKIRIVAVLPSGPTGEVASQGGANREDATAFPWGRIAIGLAVIGLVGAAFWWSRQGSRL